MGRATSTMTAKVETIYGPIIGSTDRGVSCFRGVPYGDDTSGEGRFRPPRPPRPWPGERDCTDYGQSCPQMSLGQFTGQAIDPDLGKSIGVLAEEVRTGEDCLVLNVWTPTLDQARALPVLVWLHGGGWSVGSAS